MRLLLLNGGVVDSPHVVTHVEVEQRPALAARLERGKGFLIRLLQGKTSTSFCRCFYKFGPVPINDMQFIKQIGFMVQKDAQCSEIYGKTKLYFFGEIVDFVLIILRK